MYDFKVKTEDEVRKTAQGLQIMEAMRMNRTRRRELMKANKGLRIKGSTKPIVNIKDK